MEAAAFSTGVSIQYPHGRSAARYSTNHRDEAVEYPFPFPADSKAASQRQYRSDTETYSVCQELAYHFACEKTRRAVQELLRKNNDTSYSQVLRFFEKYCTRDDLESVAVAVAPSPASGRRLRNTNDPVLFPEFHAFPTAAVIAGTDATSSDLWVEPLTHKLRRTFPLCIVVPRDVTTARRFMEWLAARMTKLCEMKKKEEEWLEGLVDNFDLLPLDQPPVAVGNVGRRVTRNQRAKALEDKSQNEEGGQHEESDASFFDSSSVSEGSDEEEEFGRFKRGKRKRKLPLVVYGRWTMSKLLTTIQNEMEELMSPTSGDTSREWVAMLAELVHGRLQEALTWVRKIHDKEGAMVTQSIACFDEAVAWLQRKILVYQNTAVKLLNVAPEVESGSHADGHIGSSEMALAQMLQRVFVQYVSFLEECTLDSSVVHDRRKSVKQDMFNHENHYTEKSNKLGTDVVAQLQTPTAPRPFLLLCIDQLEAFSQQVFGDFLEIWTHFMRQQQENRPASEMKCTLGFVIGVASATSPTLRRLDLTVTNRLELQFFSLVDSRKCFDNVLEALVVKAKLPLALSGDVLRAIATRHRRLPSVPRLLLDLRFLLFTHFRRCPWSFLALAVDNLSSSGESPILVTANVARLPHRVSSWVRRQRRRLTREAQGKSVGSDVTLASWLAPCSALELRDLALRVMSSNGEESWLSALESALLNERRRQARWRMGWECFRSACSWLDVRIDGSSNDRDQDSQGDIAVAHLALALEGRLGEAPRLTEVLRRLQHCRWAVLSGMIDDWRASFRVFGLYEDGGDDLEATLAEVAMLCAYARTENTPTKMQVALREEVVAVFTGLITALLHPSAPGTTSRADQLVSSWSTLTDAGVLEERLRFEYHDHLRNVLQDAGIGEDIDTNNNSDSEASWVHDVGLAFLFYQESASASLSLREWYESFSSELEEANKSASIAKCKKSKASTGDAAIKARFVRAVCTLRHWGFIKSDAPRDDDQDIIEKLVFI